jgi:DHA1 family bicyclomycin/chloramphenicol resistance-like MFS transporter
MAKIAGVASAVMSGIQMLTGAAASALVAALIDARSALAMTAIMATCAAAAVSVYVFVVRPAELTDHSYRNASTGSTFAARRAGT